MSLYKILLFGAFWVAIAAPINVYADWKLVAHTSTDDAVYVDSSSIRRNKAIVKIWVLLDYKTPKFANEKRYLSTKTHYKFDCSEERYTHLYIADYSENMGSGMMVSGYGYDDKSKSYPVIPESINSRVFNFSCGKAG